MRFHDILGPDDYAAINEAWARRWARFKAWLQARRDAQARRRQALDRPFPFENCAPEGAWQVPDDVLNQTSARNRQAPALLD